MAKPRARPWAWGCQLDAAQLFYLRQRGIPLVQARALLTEAFIAQALEEAGIHDDALRAQAQAWLSEV